MSLLPSATILPCNRSEFLASPLGSSASALPLTHQRKPTPAPGRWDHMVSLACSFFTQRSGGGFRASCPWASTHLASWTEPVGQACASSPVTSALDRLGLATWGTGMRTESMNFCAARGRRRGHEGLAAVDGTRPNRQVPALHLAPAPRPVDMPRYRCRRRSTRVDGPRKPPDRGSQPPHVAEASAASVLWAQCKLARRASRMRRDCQRPLISD